MSELIDPQLIGDLLVTIMGKNLLKVVIKDILSVTLFKGRSKFDSKLLLPLIEFFILALLLRGIQEK